MRISAWCLIDAEVERYDLDKEPSGISALLYWVPLFGLFYYFVLIRGVRGSAPLVAKSVLFALLLFALFETAKQLSKNVLSNS